MKVQLMGAQERQHPVVESALSDGEYLALLQGLRSTLKREVTRRRSVREFLFSVRAINVMRRYQLETIGDLLDLSWEHLLKMDGFGLVCINEVARELSGLGCEGTAFQKIAECGSKQVAQKRWMK